MLGGPGRNGLRVRDLTRLRCQVKKKLVEPWQKRAQSAARAADRPLLPEDENGLAFSKSQSEAWPWVSSYSDIVIGDRGGLTSGELHDLMALHTLNHVLKTRDRILANTERINAAAASGTTNALDVRDQTFARPTVLVLLPFRSSAHLFVRSLIALSGSSQQENKARFEDEYGDGGEAKHFDQSKPEEFRRLFAGNTDDNFKIGLKITRKAVKLFTDFFSSDIIVASPLGLRTVSEKARGKDDIGDFLSSIQVAFLDQCDVFLMQNWEHVQHVFKNLNLIPKDPHGCDFSRVKQWCLDGKARFVRQTVIVSSLNSPDINALVKKSCHNISGLVRTARTYAGVDRSFATVSQIFRRFDCGKPAEEAEMRFRFFIENLLPSLQIASLPGLLVFVSSYFEFVRLRNHLAKGDFSFTSLSEYTEPADVNRNRAKFAKGDFRVLLVTERVHFFRRYRIKGVNRVLFYSLPEHPSFYSDMLRLIPPSGGGSSVAMFCKLDRLKLERIVGTERANDWLLSPSKNTFT
ncbi:digestive organ expansion factor [Hyaloraphidium curvatum]|nr:digestive organ expansion factor [Hyaloraphidium curvatum]